MVAEGSNGGAGGAAVASKPGDGGGAASPRRALLEVRDLHTRFRTGAGLANAVSGVDFDVYEGEVLGIVGESGSGKSVLSLSVMRLIPNPPGEIHKGSVRFRGRELLDLSWSEMRAIRGREIAMIFQEPMTSLNPVYTIGAQVTESLKYHSSESGRGGLAGQLFRGGVRTLSDQSPLIPLLLFAGCWGLGQFVLPGQLTTLLLWFCVGYALLRAAVGSLRAFAPKLHERLSGFELHEQAQGRGVELLDEVGIPDPAARMSDYPHQFSGGMRQRAMIAQALAGKPSLLIADEPTTALDVTIQAQILELMMKVKARRAESAVILITHDLAVVAETCDRVLVMYGGKVQEVAPVRELFGDPKHPYTVGLLRSLPSPEETGQERLATIPGMVPNIHDFPAGCRFSNRCDDAEERCITDEPALHKLSDQRSVRCHLFEQDRIAV